mmetsp:Transcript_12736/g.31418  ORF Transcript_12736/g.31418 Transcript_12736/m.31418 type:complete len:205 (-) Transcript_12736:676-1290(-)
MTASVPSIGRATSGVAPFALCACCALCCFGRCSMVWRVTSAAFDSRVIDALAYRSGAKSRDILLLRLACITVSTKLPAAAAPTTAPAPRAVAATTGAAATGIGTPGFRFRVTCEPRLTGPDGKSRQGNGFLACSRKLRAALSTLRLLWSLTGRTSVTAMSLDAWVSRSATACLESARLTSVALPDWKSSGMEDDKERGCLRNKS